MFASPSMTFTLPTYAADLAHQMVDAPSPPPRRTRPFNDLVSNFLDIEALQAEATDEQSSPSSWLLFDIYFGVSIKISVDSLWNFCNLRFICPRLVWSGVVCGQVSLPFHMVFHISKGRQMEFRDLKDLSSPRLVSVGPVLFIFQDKNVCNSKHHVPLGSESYPIFSLASLRTHGCASRIREISSMAV